MRVDGCGFGISDAGRIHVSGIRNGLGQEVDQCGRQEHDRLRAVSVSVLTVWIWVDVRVWLCTHGRHRRNCTEQSFVCCFDAVANAVLSWLGPTRRLEPEMIANGLLNGVVGIMAGCSVVNTGGAAIIGLVSG